MHINIKATNIEVTSSLSNHIEKCMESIGKVLNDEEAKVQVEVGKTTNHHKQGGIYKAEIDVRSKGKTFFAMAESEDIIHSLDQAKESILREVTDKKDRRKTLYKRGATSVKKMMKGLSTRNPLTSKY